MYYLYDKGGLFFNYIFITMARVFRGHSIRRPTILGGRSMTFSRIIANSVRGIGAIGTSFTTIHIVGSRGGVSRYYLTTAYQASGNGIATTLSVGQGIYSRQFFLYMKRICVLGPSVTFTVLGLFYAIIKGFIVYLGGLGGSSYHHGTYLRLYRCTYGLVGQLYMLVYMNRGTQWLSSQGYTYGNGRDTRSTCYNVGRYICRSY